MEIITWWSKNKDSMKTFYANKTPSMRDSVFYFIMDIIVLIWYELKSTSTITILFVFYATLDWNDMAHISCSLSVA